MQDKMNLSALSSEELSQITGVVELTDSDLEQVSGALATQHEDFPGGWGYGYGYGYGGGWWNPGWGYGYGGGGGWWNPGWGYGYGHGDLH